MKYYKLRRFDSDIHVFEYNPKNNPSQISFGTVGKNQPLSSIGHKWYDDNGYKSVAKINFGFFDPGGKTEHIGWVAHDSGFMSGHPRGTWGVECWLDKNYKFHVGNLELEEAKELYKNVFWGGSLSYSLLINGKKNFISKEQYSHFNQRHPRTLIGQKSDGTMVLVVVDGRISPNKGVTGEQSADIMIELKCLNAASADGGGSSQLIFNDKIVNVPSDRVERNIGTALLVFAKKNEKPQQENGNSLSSINYRIEHIRNRSNTVPGDKMNPKYLMIHTTNNFKASANAEMHRRFLNQTSSYVSFNLVVDDVEAIELVSPRLVTYHAGDGRYGHYNSNAISMEICVHNLVNGKLHPSTYKNAVLTAAKMVKEYNVKLVQHRDVPERSWKNCPHTDVLDYKQFCLDVEKVVKGQKVELDTSKIEWTGQVLRKGDSGTLVKDLQLMLIELGYLKGTVDGSFGNFTRNAVLVAQKDLKITVDGLAGKGTYFALTQKLIEKKEKEPKTDNYFVEVSGFNIYQDASTLAKELEKMGYKPVIKKEVY
jgi:hypothetical protein